MLKKAKTNSKNLIDKAILDFEKGDAEHMTYAIERMFDEIEEKALIRGREEGIEKGQIEMAKAMLADGEPIEKITRWIKLPPEIIKNLQ